MKQQSISFEYPALVFQSTCGVTMPCDEWKRCFAASNRAKSSEMPFLNLNGPKSGETPLPLWAHFVVI